VQREEPAAFLVTGYIELTSGTRVENTRTLLPGLLGIDLGTTRASVRAPGRISYGIQLSVLGRDSFRLVEGGIIEVLVPAPNLYSVEPNLAALEIETSRGWARVSGRTEQLVRDRAIALLQETMRAQGERHLVGSTQPRINTAKALETMLKPAFAAAGIPDAQFRFVLGDRIRIEPEGLRGR
jgi:hypothetical protein